MPFFGMFVVVTLFVIRVEAVATVATSVNWCITLPHLIWSDWPPTSSEDYTFFSTSNTDCCFSMYMYYTLHWCHKLVAGSVWCLAWTYGRHVSGL